MPAPRFVPPEPATLDVAQRRVYDATAAGRRGSVPANVLAWLPSPELAQRAQHLGAFLRYETSLEPRWRELAILVVARRWSAQYEWAVHAVEAQRAGLPDEVIAAVRERRPPTLAEGIDRVVFAVATALVHDGVLADGTFAAADAALGRQRLVELVGLVGYYTMVAMTLNAFEVAPPPGSPSLP
jgi:4-carboxymuconolactone decarboxylase